MEKSKNTKRQPAKSRNWSRPSAVIVATLIFGAGLFLFQQYRLQAQKNKLIRQLGSQNNGIARNTVRELLTLGWIEDGTLRGANLQNANLEGVELWAADLRDVNLQGANLQRVELVNADLSNANLNGVDLRGSRLWTINLQGSNLQDADLRTSELIEANLAGVNLAGALFDEDTPLPDSVYVGDDDNGNSLFDVYWTPDVDMSRYTDQSHPEFWQPAWTTGQSGR